MNYYCIDAGSPYCPCPLAEIDSCLVCSMLQGKEACDCKWQGICVYQEFVWAGKKAGTSRQEIRASIIEKNKLTEKLLQFKIALPVPAEIKEFDQPGAFVFMRPSDTPRSFDMPLCVMDTDKDTGTLTFAIHIRGPKTKAVERAKGKEVILRGPFWNGVFGLKHIKSSFNKHWLIIARGMGQASLMPIIRNLLRANNRITVILDQGELGINLTEHTLRKINVNLEILSSTKKLKETVTKHLSQQASVDFVFSAGSDKQHKLLWKTLKENGYQKQFIMSNNYSMCCGEGICGSCITKINGERVHLCKTQMDSENVLGGYSNA